MFIHMGMVKDAVTQEIALTIHHAPTVRIVLPTGISMPQGHIQAPIAAFLPVLMVSGTSGQFMSPIGWVVVLCLMFSIVESKLILPAHLAHMKVKHYGEETHNPFVRFQRFFSEGLHHFVDDWYAISRGT